tara:strand:+ start:3938 stop:4822 length:885 start_codon:yes stop_codon:yes gene_type:complete
MNARQLQAAYFGKAAGGFQRQRQQWMTEREYDALRKGDQILVDLNTGLWSNEVTLTTGRTSYSKKYDVYSKTMYFTDDMGLPITKGKAPLKLFKRMSYRGEILDPPSISLSFGGGATTVKSYKKLASMDKYALRQKTFLHLMNKGGSFGIVSAYTTISKSENQERHGMLMGDLQKMGYRKITTLRGKWEGVSEKALLIPNINPSHLFALGEKYGQDATIYKSKNGVVGMYYHKGKYAEVAVETKGDPAFQMADGADLYSKDRNWSFELGFAWGKHIAWDGKTPLGRKDALLALQ